MPLSGRKIYESESSITCAKTGYVLWICQWVVRTPCVRHHSGNRLTRVLPRQYCPLQSRICIRTQRGESLTYTAKRYDTSCGNTKEREHHATSIIQSIHTHNQKDCKFILIEPCTATIGDRTCSPPTTS